MMDNNNNNESEVKLSLETVREFLLKHDGKVKQTDLINHFRAELTSISTKNRARQEFKDILLLITAVKTENGEKYILLTKNNQEHIHQTSLINRKANRPLSARKELCRSSTEHYSEHLQTPFASEGAFSHHHCDSKQNSPLPDKRKISSESANSLSVETRTVGSVSLLRDALTAKIIAASSRVSSVDSLYSEDLDDDFLNDEVEVQPEEKEWMLASSCGRLETLKRLLEKFPYLVSNRDFIFGYTALHWAAKLGRSDIIEFISANCIDDVHTKSHGGYTPLHVASMSGKDSAIIQLIELGANIHSRDHSGKKPKDIVKDTVAAAVQRKLGRSLIIDTNTVLQTGVISTIQAQRNKKTRRSFSTTSDGEGSPLGTPDLTRRRMKSVGVCAQRSLSFLKKKKRRDSKLTANDILHSPMTERPISNIMIPSNKNESPPQRRPSSDSFCSNSFTFDV